MTEPASTNHCQRDTVRPRPAVLRALGDADPPDEIEIAVVHYRLERVFKHDSVAATALYCSPHGRVVCKFQRRQPVGFIPLFWAGWFLAWHETRVLRHLDGLPNVPRWSGVVRAGGRRLLNAVAHEFIPGRTLRLGEVLSPRFFDELRRVLIEVHHREMAYVDLHKRENILLGDDGKPYLFDFQASYFLPRWPIRFLGPFRSLLKALQASDSYHLQKHINEMTPATHVGRICLEQVRPWWIRVHRRFSVPMRSLRRWLLAKLRVRAATGRAETEHFVEEGLRG